MTRTKTFPAMRTAIATAAALLVVGAAPAAAAPIASAPPPPSLPDFQGHAVRAHPVTPTRAPQNPFMGANPFNNIHNDTWMTDAYQIARPAGLEPRCQLGCEGGGALRLAHLRHPRPDPLRLPLRGRAAAGADHRPRHAGDDRQRRSAAGAGPTRHQDLPELHRRRLLLPRQQGPHLGADQDRPHLRDRRVGRRPVPSSCAVTTTSPASSTRAASGSPRPCPTSPGGSGSSRRRTARSGRSTARPARSR